MSLNKIGAACAGVVAIRRRCSFGEITEDEPAQSQGPSLLVTPAQVIYIGVLRDMTETFS